MGKKQKKVRDCSPAECGMEIKVDGFISKITQAIEKLTDNQHSLSLSIQKLTDQGEFVNKLDQKIDRVEAKVDKNSQMVWKMAGVGMAAVVMIPLLFQVFIK